MCEMKNQQLSKKAVASVVKTVVLIGLFYALSSGLALAAYPATWPSDAAWTAYTRFGSSILDLSTASGDASNGGTGVSPDYVDVFSGTAGTLPSAYYFYDATNQVFFYRMRLLGDPRKGSGLSQGTWNVLIDTDGDGYKEYFVEVNGNDNLINLYYGDADRQDLPNGYTCAANNQGKVWSQAITLGTQVRVVDASASGGGYLLDYQVPLSAYKNCSGTLGLTSTTPFTMAFTTSTTSQDPTKKDFVGAGSFTMNVASRFPGGDVIALSGSPTQAPQITSYSQVCGSGANANPVALSINTLDTLNVVGSAVSDSIANVTFSYQLLGASTWTRIGNSLTAPVTGTVNQWTTSWNTSAIPTGTYRIRIDVVDDQAHTTTDASNTLNLANCSGVTYVDLAAFNAMLIAPQQALLQWQTGFEADNLGFNLYREINGKRELVNPQVIAGSALVAGAGTVLAAGQAYEVLDLSAEANAAYWLEDLDLKGQSTWHGPFYLTLESTFVQAPSSSAYLSQLGTEHGESRVAGDGSTVVEAVHQPLRKKARQALSATLATEALWLAASPNYLKIGVKREGWYRLTSAELTASGFSINGDWRKLQLFTDGQEVPCVVVADGKNGFQALEFYGLGLDTAAADVHNYWLVQGNQDGKRIGESKTVGTPTAKQSFVQTVERKDRSIYFSALRNGETENFFGAVITSAASVKQSLTLPHISFTTDREAILEVALQGVTLVAHRVRVQINGQHAGEVVFNGQERGVNQFAIPINVLQEGANTISLLAENSGSDVSLVDTLRLQYPHTFQADNDALKLQARGGEQLTVSGFTVETLRVFDVSNPVAVQEIIGQITKSADGYAFTFAPTGVGNRQLLVLRSDQAKTPEALKIKTRSNLTHGEKLADFIVITSNDLLQSVEPLRLARRREGYKTLVVDIDDIYDEFNNGNKAPQAIKDFLRYAKTTWKQAPRFVLLVGDASYDAKNYSGKGNFDVIPTKLLDTKAMETASDDWLGDFNDDGLADLAIGRLPARSVAEASVMINKILGYGLATSNAAALFISDASEGYNFEASSTQARQQLPVNFQVQEIKRGAVDAATAKAELVEALASGQQFVNYAGHGSVNLWRGNLLTAEAARNLTNQQLPLFALMTCLNGYFHDPALDSLAEALMKAERGGAVAVWASSAITKADIQANLNREALRLLMQGGQTITIGEAVRRAKQAISDRDVQLSWIFFGDPTMKLR
ncbi:MAG: hypothetical protein HY231_20020 [Acidobacteria bacterium]|nr:hypothetical protein [Acidobacteriota bacterium]